MVLEDDSMFDLVSKAIIWHLSTPDKLRVESAVRLSRTLNAAGPMLFEIATKMLAITSSHRFLTFQKIVLLLACYSEQNCKLSSDKHVSSFSQGQNKSLTALLINFA